MLLSCNVILLGAVRTLKIPWWGGSATGVVSGLSEGQVWCFFVLFFSFSET